MRSRARLRIAVVAAAFLVGAAGCSTVEEPVASTSVDDDPVAGMVQEPSRTLTPSPSPTRRGMCDDEGRPVQPTSITIPGVAQRAPVLSPPRDANGIPGVPPLSGEGKAAFAWDREQGIRPGDPRGNALLNAHTWPDGTALGNDLLIGLRKGDRIVVQGSGARLCYRVSERVEVMAADGLPRYYATDGPHQLAIVACSGRRLGPGEWEKRTVWFATLEDQPV
ncbi:MAG TPA: class F sortase [Nocardioidaceae bacterium]|nr:class F sortase [Nocardioidaceae bacterium]